MPDERTFREVMGHFTTGVTVVTSRRPDGTPAGLTANAIASVSLDPLLVLVCLDRDALTLSSVVEGGAYAVCILPRDGEALARRFAAGARNQRFRSVAVREEATGCPILQASLAWLDCRVRDVHEAGDHVIVVGEVVACGAREGEPLLFYRGGYRRLAEERG